MQRIRRNDLVEVMAGVEKGKRGRVIKVLPKEQKVIVQGLNLRYRHVRRSQKYPQGGRIRKEMPIAISNVMPIDPETDRPTRVRYTREGDKKIRVAARSGKAIDRAKGG